MNFLATSLNDPALEDSAAYRAALEQPMSLLALLLTAVLVCLMFSRSRHVAITALIAPADGSPPSWFSFLCRSVRAFSWDNPHS
jgi:hypothetical protein